MLPNYLFTGMAGSPVENIPTHSCNRHRAPSGSRPSSSCCRGATSISGCPHFIALSRLILLIDCLPLEALRTSSAILSSWRQPRHQRWLAVLPPLAILADATRLVWRPPQLFPVCYPRATLYINLTHTIVPKVEYPTISVLILLEECGRQTRDPGATSTCSVEYSFV